MPFWQSAVASGSADAAGTRPSWAGVLTFPREVPGAPHRGVGGDRIVAVFGTVGSEGSGPVPGAPHRGVGGDRIVAVFGTVGSGLGGSGGVAAVFEVVLAGACAVLLLDLCLQEIRIRLYSGTRARRYRSRGRCRKSYPPGDVDNFQGCLGEQIAGK